jgi:hypothetical protein
MSAPPPDNNADVEFDPVFLNSRREAILIFCLWLAGLLWAVPFCYFNGYVGNIDSEQIATIWGIPAWLFWGIAVPWVVANLFTTWFCFCYMTDDDLGEAHEGADVEEEVAELHAAQSARKEAGA